MAKDAKNRFLNKLEKMAEALRLGNDLTKDTLSTLAPTDISEATTLLLNSPIDSTTR